MFLVRHGATDAIGREITGRRAGIPLNADGQRQAVSLAAHFAGERISSIHASPLERARQTAEPIARRLGLAIATAPALDEIDVGEWTGATLQALQERPDWRRWNAFRSGSRPPGGESMIEVQARMVGFIGDLHEAEEGGRHLLVGHADPIKAAIFYYLGLPLDFIMRLEISPASVSALHIDAAGPRVLFLNRIFGQ
jgi:probable phosphoglycerate mutase